MATSSGPLDFSSPPLPPHHLRHSNPTSNDNRPATTVVVLSLSSTMTSSTPSLHSSIVDQATHSLLRGRNRYEQQNPTTNLLELARFSRRPACFSVEQPIATLNSSSSAPTAPGSVEQPPIQPSNLDPATNPYKQPHRPSNSLSRQSNWPLQLDPPISNYFSSSVEADLAILDHNITIISRHRPSPTSAALDWPIFGHSFL